MPGEFTKFYENERSRSVIARPACGRRTGEPAGTPRPRPRSTPGDDMARSPATQAGREKRRIREKGSAERPLRRNPANGLPETDQAGRPRRCMAMILAWT